MRYRIKPSPLNANKPAIALPIFNDGTVVLCIERLKERRSDEWEHYLSIRCSEKRINETVKKMDTVVRTLNSSGE